MYRVVVTPAAMADVDHLEDWLLAKDARYALDLSDALGAAVDRLLDYPQRAPLSRDGRYREFYVAFHSNQYVIQYRVRGDRVVIARIRHSLERR
ncbi:type II toxin-antitoxin system RelE/ParE family toxin [Caulobacter vibrioides]|uniref:type II toxin-antitoxin system RelE/ParE family toxin n=1 Tax=Caulobacter vibrioides TaxID=155892 RepID=UPI000BB46469|nr:type II toxin-antitoxin system RelE/ParE family toxin [Caulobacter vibrioides]ATC25783.1 type II toxin-antitoxin system RelE/ParE family toxin [Caulobacter vibrioides]AZH13926.1 type II toxin-antitoxin system RelE/ParE family toxin [Caulobacter vibrioides]PLR07591.1 type II toxin-antitoxin system RelE/ParE family toxin [Caulobacter vibrioides]